MTRSVHFLLDGVGIETENNFTELTLPRYRGVRAAAIPGGSEEILMDFAVRQAIAKAQKNMFKIF